MPLDEAAMDEILADILHKQQPRLYQYLAMMTIRGVSREDILARVATKCATNSLTYLSIQATLYFFQRKMEAKQNGKPTV